MYRHTIPKCEYSSISIVCGSPFSTLLRTACSDPTPGFPSQENTSFPATPAPIIWSYTTSGVSRHSVRLRLRWRMISWPAAKQMRWVNPSMATVSPSRTSSPIASRIDATFPSAMDRSGALRSLFGESRVARGAAFLHLGAGLLEDLEAGLGLVRADHQRGRDPHGPVTGAERQDTAPERGLLHGVGRVVLRELDTDHEAQAPDLRDH